MASQKFNMFQRGILQVTAYVIVSLAFFGLTGFLVDFFEKWRFITIIQGAQRQGLISADGFHSVKHLIESMSWVAAFLPIAIGTARVCGSFRGRTAASMPICKP